MISLSLRLMHSSYILIACSKSSQDAYTTVCNARPRSQATGALLSKKCAACFIQTEYRRSQMEQESAPSDSGSSLREGNSGLLALRTGSHPVAMYARRCPFPPLHTACARKAVGQPDRCMTGRPLLRLSQGSNPADRTKTRETCSCTSQYSWGSFSSWEDGHSFCTPSQACLRRSPPA
jgi:hypothetical protein